MELNEISTEVLKEELAKRTAEAFEDRAQRTIRRTTEQALAIAVEEYFVAVEQFYKIDEANIKDLEQKFVELATEMVSSYWSLKQEEERRRNEKTR